MNLNRVKSRSAKLVETALKEKAKREGNDAETARLTSPNVFLQSYASVGMLGSRGSRPRGTPRSLFPSNADKENSPQQREQNSERKQDSRSPSPEFVDCGTSDWLSKTSQKLSDTSVRTYKSKLSRTKTFPKTPDLSKSKILSDRFQKTSPSILRRSLSPVKVDIEDGTLAFSLLQDQESSPKRLRKEPRDIGLENLGNTCYINATMQCLFSLDSVISDFMQSAESRPHNKLIDCLFELIEARKSGSTSTVATTLRKWHSAVGVLDEEFAGYRMQDANELIIQLFDHIKTNYDTYNKNQGETASVLMTPESSENDTDASDEESAGYSNNPIRSNFEFKVTEEFFCVECGGKSDEKEQVADSLWLPVRRETDSQQLEEDEELPIPIVTRRLSCLTLDEAFSEAMKEDRDSMCENCGKKTRNAAELKFATLPRVLMIQLKRYVYREGNLDKLLNPIEIAPSLDLSRYISSATRGPLSWRKEEVKLESFPKTPSSVGDGSLLEGACEVTACPGSTQGDSLGCVYRLLGVIQHIGSSAHSGHYIADTFSPIEAVWRHYDDTDVSQVDQSSVITDDASKNAYILFYVHGNVFQEMEKN